MRREAGLDCAKRPQGFRETAISCSGLSKVEKKRVSFDKIETTVARARGTLEEKRATHGLKYIAHGLRRIVHGLKYVAHDPNRISHGLSDTAQWPWVHPARGGVGLD